MSISRVSQANARLPELDGLRALAVVAVIVFHCDISGLFNAGFFGVDIFFTISGFIITALMLKEHRRNGDFSFREFYARRMKRLLPAVLGWISLSYLITAFVSDVGYARFKNDVPAALLYVSNWWQIWSRQPYFEASASPRMLTHLWSLAIEAQFYLIWPPVVYVVLKRFGYKAVGVFALILAALSTVLMFCLYDGVDPMRVYLGTDTHAMGLLAGAALACWWNPWADRQAQSMSKRGRMALAACAALAVSAYMIQTMNDRSSFTYQGAFLLVPLLTCVVIYCSLNDPGFLLSRALRHPVIQWLGSRSYSLYLVHWLVFSWMRLAGVGDFANGLYLAAAITGTCALSELSYRYLEMPFQKMDFNRATTAFKAVSASAYVLVASALFIGAILVEGGQTPAPQIAAAPPVNAPVTMEAPPPTAADKANDAATTVSLSTVEKISGGEEIYAIGDSVLLGASNYLSKSIPGIHIDAAVGRQASEGVKIVKALDSKSNGPKTVLVHLGTNGYINEAQFKDLLQALSSRELVLVITVHANRRWTEPNNEIIERLAHDFPNVHLINWHVISSDRPDYFVKDGIHLTTAGIFALTTEIKRATGGTVLVASAAKPPGSSTGKAKDKAPLTLAENTAAAPEAKAAAQGEADMQAKPAGQSGDTSAPSKPGVETGDTAPESH